MKKEIYCRPIGEVKVKGIAHGLRTYEVVGELSKVKESGPIEAVAKGFNLQLDPASMKGHEAEQAREALRQALAALEE